MTLTKRETIREIGRRTRLKNRDVQRVFEAFVEVWTEELLRGGRVEIEHFLVLDAQPLHPKARKSIPFPPSIPQSQPTGHLRVRVRVSKHLRNLLKNAVP